MGVFGGNYIAKETEISEAEQILFLDLFTQSVLEDYISDEDLESIDEACEVDLVTEGANFEGFKEVVKAKKTMRTYKKQYRKAMKSKDFKEAVKIAGDLKKELENIEKELSKIDWDNIQTAVIGFLTGFVIELAQMMATCLLIYYPIMGISSKVAGTGIKKILSGNIVKGVKTTKNGIKGMQFAYNAGYFGGLVKELITGVKNLAVAGDPNSTLNKNTKTGNEAVNYFRTILYRLLNDCKRAADKLADNAREAEKKFKEKEKENK